jgi:hypothetical protein
MRPFPIADFKTGLFEAREPWLSPADAMTTVKNVYIRRGVMRKRKGYSQYVQMNHYNSAISNVTQANPGAVTSNAHGLDNGDTVLIYDVTGMTELNGNTYTVANKTANTFELSGTDTSGFTAYGSGGKIATYQTNAITGIKEFIDSTGDRELLIFDEDRVGKYNAGTEELEDLVEADTFTGDNEDFFNAENWKGKIYFTNNVDRLYSYDGSSVAAVDVDIDGDASNELDTCLAVLTFKERLILFRTTEDGTVYPQRIRWSKAGDPDVWDDTINNGGGFLDVPTGQWLQGAAYVKDGIALFFERSIWMLRYTGNVDLPFAVTSIRDFERGAEKIEAPYSIINIGEEAWAFGTTGFFGTNGFQSFQMEGSVPDISLKSDLGKANIVSSGSLDELDQIWIAYPTIDSTTSDSVFVFNYVEKTWSIYDIALTVMGTWSKAGTETWDGESRSWDEIRESWSEFQDQSGFPLLLGGSQSGIVWRLNHTQSDNQVAFDFDMKTSRLNPFYQQGISAKLGWVDCLVSGSSTDELSVDFFVDWDTSAHTTQTLAFSTDNSEEKVWKRVHCNAIGNSHRIRLYHTASGQQPTIHAIIPYFDEGGHII